MVTIRDIPDIQFRLAGYAAIFQHPFPAEKLYAARYLNRMSYLFITKSCSRHFCEIWGSVTVRVSLVWRHRHFLFRKITKWHGFSANWDSAKWRLITRVRWRHGRAARMCCLPVSSSAHHYSYSAPSSDTTASWSVATGRWMCDTSPEMLLGKENLTRQQTRYNGSLYLSLKPKHKNLV